MSSQKALILSQANGHFALISRSIPKPGPGEILVKIKATALNPVHWKIQAYNIVVNEYPAHLGSDVAGTVEELGEGVTSFSKGDEVLFQGDFKPDYASFQQYTLIPADIAAKIPKSISLDEAASIPVGIATAVQGLYGDRKNSNFFKLTPPWEGGEQTAKGKAILIMGGSSSVGQYVIQLAKLSGFSTIMTTASLRNASLLQSLGATDIIDRNSADIRSEIVKAAKGSPINIVYDAISLEETQSIGWDVLSSNGTLVLVLPPTVDKEKYADKYIIDDIFANVNYPHLRVLGASLYKALPELIETGKIKPNRVEVVPGGLNGIVDGLKRLQADAVSGVKLIVRPQETK